MSLQSHPVPRTYTGQLLGASNALLSWLDLGGRCLAVVIIHSVTFRCSPVRLLFTKLSCQLPRNTLTPTPCPKLPYNDFVLFPFQAVDPLVPTLVVLFILTFGISSKVPESFRIICLILFTSFYCWPRCA